MLRIPLIFIALALLSAPSISQVDDSGQLISITDEAGIKVDVPLCPERIVCLTPAVAEVIYALGESDRMVALSEDCTMPPALLEKESIGESGREADVEKILELDPDLVIAKTGSLFPEECEEQLISCGIPVLRYRVLHIDTLMPMIGDFGSILKRREEASEMSEYIDGYYDLVLNRTAGIAENERAGVYFMSMGHFDWTASSASTVHQRIVEAGGKNIAEDLEGKVPHVDMEWVIEQNPEVIVYSMPASQYEGATPTLEEMEQKRDEIMSLPGFDQIEAVKRGKVYIVDINMASGLAEVVNMLYYAQWFHPDLFLDVDPRAVHLEIYQKYFDMEGVFQVYPESVQP
ncbi:MAG TPA: ABC transporter substrate-binding protein [Methanothrix sp.]|nr:ABC transporter substrate-binding protein [Methanothrix sp.]HPJ83216.1 ABC transporter substrate-binding protein [Methanothrix sp.]HPR67590.1 ABC transporter substrate-binding protein [Methanothrix sp.]